MPVADAFRTKAVFQAMIQLLFASHEQSSKTAQQDPPRAFARQAACLAFDLKAKRQEGRPIASLAFSSHLQCLHDLLSEFSACSSDRYT